MNDLKENIKCALLSPKCRDLNAFWCDLPSLVGIFLSVGHVYRCQPKSLQDLMNIADDCSEHGRGNVEKDGS